MLSEDIQQMRCQFSAGAVELPMIPEHRDIDQPAARSEDPMSLGEDRGSVRNVFKRVYRNYPVKRAVFEGQGNRIWDLS